MIQFTQLIEHTTKHFKRRNEIAHYSTNDNTYTTIDFILEHSLYLSIQLAQWFVRLPVLRLVLPAAVEGALAGAARQQRRAILAVPHVAVRAGRRGALEVMELVLWLGDRQDALLLRRGRGRVADGGAGRAQDVLQRRHALLAVHDDRAGAHVAVLGDLSEVPHDFDGRGLQRRGVQREVVSVEAA